MPTVKSRTRIARTGVLDPSRMYTPQALNRIGIGAVLLMDARRSGVVSAYNVNGDCWYDGSELIAWLKTKPRKVVGK